MWNSFLISVVFKPPFTKSCITCFPMTLSTSDCHKKLNTNLITIPYKTRERSEIKRYINCEINNDLTSYSTKWCSWKGWWLSIASKIMIYWVWILIIYRVIWNFKLHFRCSYSNRNLTNLKKEKDFGNLIILKIMHMLMSKTQP
jgi:hypothetical protein